MTRFFSLLLLCCFSLQCLASSTKKLNKAYEALLQFDYFKARNAFYSLNKKEVHFSAAYGLATIFYRKDNPFNNMDSALKYISLPYSSYLQKHQAYSYKTMRVDSIGILKLADSISNYQYNKVKNKGVVELEKFLKENTLAPFNTRNKAIYLRDELVFNRVTMINKSDSTVSFMTSYPLSVFYKAAEILLQRQLYLESTVHQKPEEWIAFLKKHPHSIMVNEAYENLFENYRKRQNIAGLASFVKNYPKAPQLLEAWKLLFSLSVKAYTSDDLKKFLDEYPSFPLKNSILKELELNKLNLLAFQKDDYIGFIDEDAHVVIEPQFDQASAFYEGLSVVSKNDSTFFINKEKVNPFNRFYQDAYPFKNGIAAVKQNKYWVFINRQGQIISKNYEELNEISDNFYVFKQNGFYGAFNQFAQVFLEAKFDKLGDFKNGVAYYVKDGKYGFVNNKGNVYKEEFDWISDFDDQQLAIYKMNNKFGLIDVNGKKILESEYDQIIKLSDDYYLIINNNLYGFYSKQACFVSPIVYEYNKEKNSDYYFKNNYFKLMKKGEIAIVDANGHLEINFGSYKEIDFANDGLMLARKKTKYGFIDKKMNTVIPFKYQIAQAFNNGVSLVKLKNEFQLIDVNGKEIFVSEKPIEIYNANYYLIEDENKTLINKKGEAILKDIASIQELNNKLLLVTFSNGDHKLLKD